MKLKQKLSSRKFCCVVSGFATVVMAAIGSNPDSIANAAAIIAAAGRVLSKAAAAMSIVPGAGNMLKNRFVFSERS